jgi:hypothetical protein
MKTPEPTPLDADYYPRIKHKRRWYLIVPEINVHYGCAFNGSGGEEPCKLIHENGGSVHKLPMFQRHDCGDAGTIFITPSNFPQYRAHLVAKKLEDKT